MYKKFLLSIVSISFLISCAKEELKPSDYSEVVNEKFTGDLAYQVTDIVEDYWRVVGNTGFNKSIEKVAEELQKAGFVNEENASEENRLTYRIEKRPMKRPTWESVNASVIIDGETLLSHDSNRNMIALNSYSTAKEGISAEMIHVKDVKNIGKIDVKGKIVFVETHPYRTFKSAIQDGGALGILSYNMPNYLQPEKNTTSIQFRSIPLDTIAKSWAIALSYEAKENLLKQLKKGKTVATVKVETNIYPSEELTLVADVKGSLLPKERLVFSAHVQEPGANDNASGVGVALEMAKVTADLIQSEQLDVKRTLTFLWGDEITSTNRYVKEDSIRAKDIKWGISLDMVGEDTEKTGGVFLIEKMPDPSAIWTRGNDQHTEWGGRKMKLEEMKPHYLNDFLIQKFEEQGALANWKVSNNPFEGGSDHVPFLRSDIPSVLFWHFTDQFYHTDNDRIDKVSKSTLKNVGTAALVSAYTLLNSDEVTSKSVILDLESAAINRLNEELKQGKIALQKGDSLSTQIAIINAWEDWYLKSLETTFDMVQDSASIKSSIEKSQGKVKEKAQQIVTELQKN
jgi:hypothetical protein